MSNSQESSAIAYMLILTVCASLIIYASIDDAKSNITKKVSNINATCPEPVCPGFPVINTSCPAFPDMDCDCPDQPDCVLIEEPDPPISHFQQVINSICTERDYELDEWDCSDESEEGVKRLKNAGYTGWHMVCGLYYFDELGSDKGRHCWATDGDLLVEFTTCQIVHPRDYWRYQR